MIGSYFTSEYNKNIIARMENAGAVVSFPLALQFASCRKLPVTMLDSKMLCGNFCSRFIVITHERASNEACHQTYICIYILLRKGIVSSHSLKENTVREVSGLCFQVCTIRYTVCCTYYCTVIFKIYILSLSCNSIMLCEYFVKN